MAQRRQVVEAPGHQPVVNPVDLLAQLERLLEHRAGGFEVAEALIGEPQGFELMGEKLGLVLEGAQGLGPSAFQDLVGGERPAAARIRIGGAHQVAGEGGEGLGLRSASAASAAESCCSSSTARIRRWPSSQAVEPAARNATITAAANSHRR